MTNGVLSAITVERSVYSKVDQTHSEALFVLKDLMLTN